jgi:phosphatidylglycerol:prolipoprotein diacylglycerol transferase
MLEALIPYVKFPEYTLARNVPIIHDLKLQIFGPLVAVGVVLGWKQCLRYAKLKDMDEFLFRDYLFWMLVTAFVVSHWVSVIFYFPDQIRQDPLVLLYIWNGLSSVGGFFGAFLGMTWYLKKHKQPIIVYADATIFGLVLGWCFGRLGCSLVHDHPGKVVPEGTFMAVGPWPDGTWRYDLGLIEFLFAVCVMTFIYGFSKWRTRRPGWIVGFVVTAYAPFRFMLDFLRADDPGKVISTPDVRYAGLTTAQWFCVAFLMAGLWLMFFRKPRPDDLKYAKDSERVAREAAAAGMAATKADADEVARKRKLADDEAEARSDE